MSVLTPSRTKLRLLPRLIALLMASLVLLLAVLAVSPEAHEWLHGEGLGQDHECVVTLFAQGIHAGCEPVVVPLPVIEACDQQASAGELLLASPEYLHVPGRAPPAVGC
jgi:hypothetical protein